MNYRVFGWLGKCEKDRLSRMSASSKFSPQLRQFASCWTLSGQPSLEKEWSFPEKFRRAKASGFDAMGGGADIPAAELCREADLGYVCYMDANGSNFRAKLEEAATTKPARINVQLCNHDTAPAEAVKAWIGLEEVAREMGLEADLEVHRDTCTETPEKVEEIAERFAQATGRKICYSWDFSHLAVVKHLNPPYAERLLTRPDLIQLSRQIHLRPFNGHHAQIAATDGEGKETLEFRHYVEFVDALLACWLAGAGRDDVLYVCPEFGPIQSGYGLSSFPNVWEDAIYLRRRTEEIWKNRTGQIGL